MSKPRILIPISLQFSIRYLLRTGLLHKIKSFCEPVMVLAWRDTELERELEQIGEVHAMVRSQWGAQYERTRGVLNTWHQTRFASPSTPIRERRAALDRPFKDRVRKNLHWAVRKAVGTLPGAIPALLKKESELLWRDTNAREVHRQIRRLEMDGVFCLTPFIPDEELTVRVCSLDGLPTSTAILSFDNLTTRAWIPIVFDSYMLWNRHNVDQLRRGYPEAGGSQITTVGSPQFDFYWDRRFVLEESDWRKLLHLPSGRPVILFGGGYYSCAPHEPQFLAQLDDAISRKQIPGRPLILFRRHPVDPLERWKPVLRSGKNIVHDDPWELRSTILGHTNVLDHDIAKLASTLHYSSVHVNVASTMTVDGAIFDRPQVGPAYDDSLGAKYHRAAYECYQQEHFLPILESGGLDIVRNRQDFIAAVSCALRNPNGSREGRMRIVEEICTFADGKCTERVADTLASFVDQKIRLSSAAVPAEGIAK